MIVTTCFQELLNTRDIRQFNQLATAILIASPSHERAKQIVERVLELGQDFVKDGDFADMLRVVQLAIIRADVSADDSPRLAKALAGEYPSRTSYIDRETRATIGIPAGAFDYASIHGNTQLAGGRRRESSPGVTPSVSAVWMDTVSEVGPAAVL